MQALEGMPGWGIVKGMLETAQASALEHLANRKHTKNLDDVTWYQTMYQHAKNTLDLIENKKKAGMKAKEQLDES